MHRPLEKKQKLAPGQERSLTVSLKSLRNPPLDITLKAQPLNTSILNLKDEIKAQASIPVNKVRILYKKKPVPDSKVLKDLAGEEDSSIEFSVMVLGGAAAIRKDDEEIIPFVAQGESGAEVLVKDEFWTDLKGFLIQRIRDEEQGEKVFGVFKSAWENQK
jgi:hypothetical protein